MGSAGRFRAAAAAVLLIGPVAGCDSPTAPASTPAATVVVEAPTRVQAGSTFRLKAAAYDSLGMPVPISGVQWKSSTPGVAAVDGAGSVTARTPGVVTISAQAGTGRGEAIIEVVAQLAPITALLDSLRAAWSLPALGAAIVTRDGVWALDVVGRRRASSATPVTRDDRFHLGSNLKAMTAGLIARMVDEGIINWDQPLEQVLPDLASDMRDPFRQRSVVDLLSHSAGMAPDPGGIDIAADGPAQRLQAARWGLAQQPLNGPGGFTYSNTGYMVAGLIAERAAGVPFETLIVDRLFTPLGITTAGFGAMGTPGAEDQPWQHYITPGNQRVEVAPGPMSDLPAGYGPAGRVHMSLPDWARFIHAILRAHDGAADVWSPPTAQRLITPRVHVGSDGYALGWVSTRRDWADGPILAHAGSNGLNYSVAWVAPEAGFGIIVVTNQGGTLAAVAADDAVGRLLDLYRTGR